jgi:molybdopterin converting factor small subunit
VAGTGGAPAARIVGSSGTDRLIGSSVHVQLRVPAALRELGGGHSVLSFDLDDGSTVDDLLDAIASGYPALERRIRDEQGVLRPHVNIFVGEENIRSQSGAGTVLRTGSEVSILPAISGGFDR